MKMKITSIAKTTAAVFLLGGAMCWSAAAAGGAQLWNMNCAACHGRDGKGNTMMGHRLHIRNLTEPKVQASFTDAQAAKDIKNGITKNGRPLMKAFGDKFSDAQIKELIAHVRSLKAKK